jgi:septal ring factor EnvC (AmiA/AmiB activator)
VAMAEVGPDAIQFYLKAPVISPAVKAAMEKVVAMRAELDQVGRERAAAEKDAKEAVDEQGRIRENLKTIQQNTDTYQRQLKKFDTLETQIEQLRTKVGELRGQEEAKRQALEGYLLSLDVE